jgi:hypothetical protein
VAAQIKAREIHQYYGERMKKRFLALVLTGSLGACATTQTPLFEAQPTPADRVFYKAPAKSSELATAVFIRDSGLFGAALDNHLMINEVHAATLKVGEKVVLALTTGEYVFAVATVNLFSPQPVRTIDQRLEAGRTYTYRISAATGGPIVQRVIGQAAN